MSEHRIYPGNGKLFIRRDGKPVFLGSSKAYSLTLQRKKPSKLVWTQVWRRLNKKGISETTSKKRTRKTVKVQRAIVGASLEDIKKKASQKSDFRTAQRAAALKEAKAKAKAAKATAKKTKKGPAASTHVKAPKFTKRANKGVTQR